MEKYAVLWMFAAFVGIVVLVTIASIVATHRRRKALIEWVRMRGFQHDPARNEQMDVRFPTLECLRKGDRRWAYDTITGDWNGRRFIAFNYRYRTGGGKHSKVHELTILGLESERQLKTLSIRRENLVDRAAGMLGANRDVQFQSPDFDRKFFVQSDDPDWARQAVTPSLREFLLKNNDYRLGTGENFLFAYDMTVFKVPKYEATARFLEQVLERLSA